MSKEKNNQTKRTLGDRIEGRVYEKRMRKIDVVRKSGVNKVALYKVIAGGGYNIDTLLCICDSLDLELVLKPKTK